MFILDVKQPFKSSPLFVVWESPMKWKYWLLKSKPQKLITVHSKMFVHRKIRKLLNRDLFHL